MKLWTGKSVQMLDGKLKDVELTHKVICNKQNNVYFGDNTKEWVKPQKAKTSSR